MIGLGEQFHVVINMHGTRHSQSAKRLVFVGSITTPRLSFTPIQVIGRTCKGGNIRGVGKLSGSISHFVDRSDEIPEVYRFREILDER